MYYKPSAHVLELWRRMPISSLLSCVARIRRGFRLGDQNALCFRVKVSYVTKPQFNWWELHTRNSDIPPKSGDQPTVSDRWRIIPMQACPIEPHRRGPGNISISGNLADRTLLLDGAPTVFVQRYGAEGVWALCCGIIEFQPVATGPH